MVTITEARQSVEQAKQDVETRKEEVNKAKEELSKRQAELSSPQTARRITDINQKLQREKILKQISTQQERVSQAEQELTRFETEQLRPVEQQVTQAEAYQALQNKIAEDLSGDPSYVYLRASNVTQAREIFEDAGLDPQIAENIYVQSFENMETAYSKSSASQALINLENEYDIKLPQETREKLRRDLIKTGKATFDLGQLDGINRQSMNVPTIEQTTFSPEILSGPTSQVLVKAGTQTLYPKDINISNSSISYDNRNISEQGRLYGGIYTGEDSDVQPRNILGRVIDAFSSSRQEGFKEATGQEQYNPQTGQFQQVSGLGLGSATVISRPPTLEEAKAINAATARGNFFSVSIKDIERIGEGIRQSSYIGEIPEVQLGFGSKKISVPITDLDTKSRIGIIISGGRKYLGGATEEIARNLGVPEQGYFQRNIPQRTIQVNRYPTGGTNVETQTEEKVIPGYMKEYITPEQVGKAAEVSTFGLYAVPGVFAGEQVVKVGEFIFREKSLGGGAVRYLKSYPLEAAGAGTLAGIKAFSWFKTPVIKELPVGQTRQYIQTKNGMTFVLETDSRQINYADDILASAITPEGEQIGISKFKLYSYQPGQEAEVTTKGKNLFFSPERKVIIKPRIDVSLPEKVILTDETGNIINDVFVGTRREGANIVKVSKYSGQQIPLDVKTIMSLPKTQQMALQRLAEIKTGGIPVALENVPGVLGKNYKYSQGGLKTVQLFRYGKDGEVLIYPYGKRTVYNELISQAKPILETPDLEYFQTMTGVKSSIKANQRATGNIEIIKGTSKVYKRPINEDFFSGSDGVEVISGKGTRQMKKFDFSKTQDTLSQIQTDIAKNIPKNKPTKSGRELLESLEETPVDYPIAVGGRGSFSEFAGTGEYEMTTEPASNLMSIKENVQEDFRLNERQPNINIISPSASSVIKNIEIDKNVIKNPSAQFTQPSSKEILKENVILKSDSLLAEKNVQKQVQKFLQKSTPRKPNKTTTKSPPPKIPTLVKKILKFAKGSKASATKEERAAFDVITFKGGKEVRIGKMLPKGKAEKLGVEETLKTLRASFKLKPVGATTEEDINYNVPGNLFVRSKVDAQRFVQIKNTRFRARSESGEAVRIRKNKAKKLKWW